MLEIGLLVLSTVILIIALYGKEGLDKAEFFRKTSVKFHLMVTTVFDLIIIFAFISIFVLIALLIWPILMGA